MEGCFVGTTMGHTYDKARAGEHIRVKITPELYASGIDGKTHAKE